MHIKKSECRKILMYIITIVLLLTNYTSYYCFLGKLSKEEVMIIPLIICLIIFMWYVWKKKKIKKQLIVIGILLISNIIISSIWDELSFSPEVLMLISAIICAIIVTTVVKKREIVDCYVTILVFLAIYSLIAAYIILPLHMQGRINFFPIVQDVDRSFLDMYFSMALRTYSVPRNSGFCREPGVYQFFLLIGIYFAIEHQEKSKKNSFQIIVLIITMLTTLSAIAYITSIVCIIMFMKKYNYKYSAKKMLLTLGIVVISIIVVFLLIKSNDRISKELIRTFGKWSLDSESNSLQVRWSGIVANLSLFLEKPLLGWGLVTSWLEIIDRFGYRDVTGTTFIGFSAFGIMFGIIIHLLFWKSCKSNKNGNLLWFLALMLSSLSQNLIITNFFWVFLFFSYSKTEV